MKNKKRVLGLVIIVLLMITPTLFYSLEKNVIKVPLIENLSDITADRATGIVDGYTGIIYDADINGDKIAMQSEDGLVEYDKGIWLHGNGVITFNDVREYGYEVFESYIGVNHTMIDSTNRATSFTYQFVLDGVIVYETDVFLNDSVQEFVSIDISEAEVFQIKVDSKDSNSGDHAVMGNPVFIRGSHSPYMDVFDLEFNQSYQVTDSNIMEYAEAKDYLGNDISDKITYTTDFVEGGVGTFDLTYHVVDDYGNERSRTVNIIVTDEDYSTDMTIERMRQPWVDYMYHPRQTMDSQEKKAFDLLLEKVLDFDAEDGIYVTNKPNLAYKLTINLQEHGIFVDNEHMKNITSILYDAEPRVYLIRKWTQEYSMKDGLVETVTFYMTESYVNKYDEVIQNIIDNADTFLAEAKDDMTAQQKFYYTVNAYGKWMTYSDGGELIHSLGYGYGKCGGNAMGIVHLGHRLNIKSNYGNGNVGEVGFHAWSYQKFPEEDGYYFTDYLWGRMLRTPNDDTYYPYRASGAYTWFEENQENYSTDGKKFRYPSVWMEVESDELHLTKTEDYDFLDNVAEIDSIFDDNVELSDIEVSIRFKNDDYNNDDYCLDFLDGDKDKFLLGEYILTYYVNYFGFEVTKEVDLIISEEEVADNSVLLSTSGTFSSETGVYDGEDEFIADGYRLNNSTYVIFNVEDKDYKSINFYYSAREYVRTDSYAIAYAKMRLVVYFDDVAVYTSGDFTAFTPYEEIMLLIPEGTKEIKLANVALGQGSHGAVNNITFGTWNGMEEEFKEQVTYWEVIKEPTYTQTGIKVKLSDCCDCVIETVIMDKLVDEDSSTEDKDDSNTGDSNTEGNNNSNGSNTNTGNNSGNTNTGTNSGDTNSNEEEDLNEDLEEDVDIEDQDVDTEEEEEELNNDKDEDKDESVDAVIKDSNNNIVIPIVVGSVFLGAILYFIKRRRLTKDYF